jgi:hypothetical protein
MVNILKEDVLRGVVAEWLDRPSAPNLIPRDVVLDLTSNAFITDVVGPRRKDQPHAVRSGRSDSFSKGAALGFSVR